MPDKDNLEDDFALKPQQQQRGGLPLKTAKAAKKPAAKSGSKNVQGEGEAAILSYRHGHKRKNNPDVGVVTPETDPEQPKTIWAYDPHLSPELQFDSSRAQIETLIDDALASGDDAAMRAALETLKRQDSPYLNWSGKAERTSFDVDTVSLHVHERIDPMSILSALRKTMNAPTASGKQAASEEAWRQASLFAAPFENLPLRDAVDFYKHEKGWSNRLVSGDSLLVMNSLLQKESMAGQVQTIYLDPPYGIKYGSNFQPFTNKRDVKDRKDEDLTQEPEMIKAFRDTWELGIHSYLTYLRDRLLLAKELLHESGSVFVQISDENLHHVREMCDEIFGASNFVSVISYATTSGFLTNALSRAGDYVLWYAKEVKSLKYRQLYLPKEAGADKAGKYIYWDDADGKRKTTTAAERENPALIPPNRKLYAIDNLASQGWSENTSFKFEYQGASYETAANSHWKTTCEGLERLGKQGRLIQQGRSLMYRRYLDDFAAYPLNNLWVDTASGASQADPKVYVVQTRVVIAERCLLMTTDPGDLVLDPTCGSGTTAYVAEKWGRRWITCDTSRVAVTLAKQRLMTASYDYFELRYPHEGLKGGFIYKTVPHVTLKSIANNPDIDAIYERMHPAIEVALAELNKAIESPPLQEWEVPFEFPEGEEESARQPFEAFHAARQAMQKQMDLSIAAHADSEVLYDQPQASKNKRRITGPFSVEAVPFPSVRGLGEATTPEVADASIARSGESSRQHTWRDELLKTGIRGKGGQMLKFAELETLPGTKYIHVSGHLESGERVVVSFGPEYAALEQRQVEMAMREASELFPRPKMIVFCACTFDPEAAKDIDQTKGITALKAQMNTDLLTDDLKKARSSNQSFWLMGQPDMEVRKVERPKAARATGTQWKSTASIISILPRRTSLRRQGQDRHVAA